jgi:hypothetical protein
MTPTRSIDARHSSKAIDGELLLLSGGGNFEWLAGQAGWIAVQRRRWQKTPMAGEVVLAATPGPATKESLAIWRLFANVGSLGFNSRSWPVDCRNCTDSTELEAEPEEGT